MERQETCTWTLNDDGYGVWFATCGSAWSFTEGGPEDNNFNFCHKCGGALVIVRPEPEPEQETFDDDVTGQRWADG